MEAKGTQYIQFMPVNSCLGPGPIFGPGKEIHIQLTEFENEGFSMATRVGNHVFVLRNVPSIYGTNTTTKVWHTGVEKNGKYTYTPVAGNESEGGYQNLQVVSLKTVVDDAEERYEREKWLETMRKQVRRKKRKTA